MSHIELFKNFYWVGESIAGFTLKNSYLLIEGDSGILLDPGLFYDEIMEKIRKTWPQLKLRYVVFPSINFEHYPVVWDIANDTSHDGTEIIVHKIHEKYLSPIDSAGRIMFLSEGVIKFGNTHLRFLPVDITNFPGTLFVSINGALLTGPLFSAFQEREEDGIFAASQVYFEKIAEFHDGYHIGPRFLEKPLEILKTTKPQMICPASGLIIKGELVNALVNFFSKMEQEESLYEEITNNALEIISTRLSLRDALPELLKLFENTNLKIRDMAVFTSTVSPVLITSDGKIKEFQEFDVDPILYKVKGTKRVDSSFIENHLSRGEFYLFPVKKGEKILGVLIVSFEKTPEDEELELISQLIPSLTVALERENLYIRLLIEARKYREQSFRDSLTGLFNKNFMFQAERIAVGTLERTGKPFCVVMMDIDDFKNINDTYGHLTGDVVLETIGHIFQTKSRKIDIVLRFGGEEFLAILPSTGTKGGFIYAEKIRNLVSERVFRTKMGTFKVTMSAGIASSEQLGKKKLEEIDELIKMADEALYTAKRTGKNRSVIYGAK